MSYRLLTRTGDKVELYKSRGKVTGRYLLNTEILMITEGKFKGQFAVPKWKKSESSRGQKYFQLLPSIYLVHRQIANILMQYDLPFYGEKSVMKAAIEAARELNLVIINLKKGNVEEYINILTEKVDKIFAIVGRVRDEGKIHGLRVIEPIVTGKDSLLKVNPGAFRARTIASVNRFGQRSSNIDRIEAHIIYRLTASKAVFDFAEYTLASACHFLYAIYDYAAERKFEVDMEVQRRMAGRLEAIIADLQTITFQPFTANCALCVGELQKAAKLIKIGNIKDAAHQISISYNSLKLKEVQGEIEDLIMEITFLINSDAFSEETGAMIVDRLRPIEEKLRNVDETDFLVKSTDGVIAAINPVYQFILEERWLEAKDILKRASEEITLYNLEEKLFEASAPF